MNRFLNKFVSVTGCLLAVAVSACASEYRGAPISGQVVDAKTKQPLAGVVVVAEWRLYKRYALHPSFAGRLLMQEAVTDQAGTYRVPAWGPLGSPNGALDRTAPMLHFYKRGYRYEVRANEFLPDYVALPEPLTSVHDTKTIELEPFNEVLAAGSYHRELGDADQLLSLADESCGWQQIPRMTAALLKRKRDYIARGALQSLPTIEALHRGGTCADPRAFLGRKLDE